jgi:bifunctional DNA-binding transcriptional regulator/antitoxin component of YhaV-PrlF toxin-antitoxin module
MYASMNFPQNNQSVPKPTMMQEKGQVTIPANLRRKYQLEKGTMISFVETDKGLLISPREAIALDTLKKLGKALKDKGITLDQLIEDGREIRGELIKEKYDLDPNQC